MGAGSPAWLATCPRACTPRSVRPATLSATSRRRMVASASSSTPCTVRAPGWRAQPANPEPSYSSSSRAVRALPALARDREQVVGLDAQRAVAGAVVARQQLARLRAQRFVLVGREALARRRIG